MLVLLGPLVVVSLLCFSFLLSMSNLLFVGMARLSRATLHDDACCCVGYECAERIRKPIRHLLNITLSTSDADLMPMGEVLGLAPIRLGPSLAFPREA